jgi:hypothetical protein
MRQVPALRSPSCLYNLRKPLRLSSQQAGETHDRTREQRPWYLVGGYDPAGLKAVYPLRVQRRKPYRSQKRFITRKSGTQS